MKCFLIFTAQHRNVWFQFQNSALSYHILLMLQNDLQKQNLVTGEEWYKSYRIEHRKRWRLKTERVGRKQRGGKRVKKKILFSYRIQKQLLFLSNRDNLILLSISTKICSLLYALIKFKSLIIF